MTAMKQNPFILHTFTMFNRIFNSNKDTFTLVLFACCNYSIVRFSFIIHPVYNFDIIYLVGQANDIRIVIIVIAINVEKPAHFV